MKRSAGPAILVAVFSILFWEGSVALFGSARAQEPSVADSVAQRLAVLERRLTAIEEVMSIDAATGDVTINATGNVALRGTEVSLSADKSSP